MIQLKLMLWGAMLAVAVGTAIYAFYTNEEEPQAHRSGNYSQDNTYQYRPNSSARQSPRPSYVRRRNKKERSSNDTCTICLQYLNNQQLDISSLVCGHEYHTHCIESWLNMEKTPKTCPICRTPATL